MNDLLQPNESQQNERPRRMRTLKGAQAAFNHEYSAVPCVVRDESVSGAKVQFEDGWWVPETFTLHVEIDGYKVECEKVWHKGQIYGVRFLGPKVQTGAGRRQTVELTDLNAPGAKEESPRSAANSTSSIRRPIGPGFGKLGQRN